MLCQKPMLRQILWRLQIEAITKSGVLPVNTFGKFVSVLEPLKKCSFDIPTTQMSIFTSFVSAGV